jgi:16S rRNA (adenine1518-N6/adenine1519-N6)-dimethyltransferase
MAYHAPWKLLNESGLRPKRSLGQNFLIDPSTAGRIVRKSGLAPQDPVLEIGAGLGALTFPLAEAAGRVYAVEKDADLARVLRQSLEKAGVGNVCVVEGDIFDVDPGGLAARENARLMVFGNLPYNISSQCLFFLAACRRWVRQADLMFQRELAVRITARPGTKDYGRLSVMMQYYADIHKTTGVSAHLFYPVPRVDSEVLQFRFRDVLEPAAASEALFSAVVKAAFGKRRKTLQNALSSSELQISREKLSASFAACGIDPQVRAETLAVSQFVHLANALHAQKVSPPSILSFTGGSHLIKFNDF